VCVCWYYCFKCVRLIHGLLIIYKSEALFVKEDKLAWSLSLYGKSVSLQNQTVYTTLITTNDFSNKIFKIFSWYSYYIYIWATLVYLHVSANLRDIVRSTTKYLQEVTTTTHCATSRKVAGSIPDGVIGIFHLHNPSGRTMSLGLTQLLTEMSTRNVSWGYRRPVLRADNLTTFMSWLSWNLGASISWNP